MTTSAMVAIHGGAARIAYRGFARVGVAPVAGIYRDDAT